MPVCGRKDGCFPRSGVACLTEQGMTCSYPLLPDMLTGLFFPPLSTSLADRLFCSRLSDLPR
ncbi:hypothetical protein predicted by Glimmer/Critica [Acetobacter senegalensis]|uniref:Uncharacterized protein n=1 Tax=Acetobacter senegalensis TaxID=446692 RepID=A0A0U5F0M9_9PROT|nr:hypothetical protein predicted by Glimmer/Critica [Acetobacter senegalensis]